MLFRSLAAGNVERNPLMAYLQRTLGRYWVIPKMAVHFAAAAVALAFPYIPVVSAVTVFALVIGVIANNNYKLAGR